MKTNLKASRISRINLRSRYIPGPMWVKHIFLKSIGMGTGSLSGVFSESETEF